MAILKIARMGHPVLGQVAAPIEDPGAPEVRRLVADMLDTMEDAGGTGLAANQVYVPRRLVIFYVSVDRAEREAQAEAGEAGDELAGDGGQQDSVTAVPGGDVQTGRARHGAKIRELVRGPGAKAWPLDGPFPSQSPPRRP